MSEKSNFKQSFKRSAIISAVIGIIAYMIITRVDWELFGFESSGGPKPAAAVEKAARTAAVAETVTIDGRTWMTKNLNVWTGSSWCYENSPDSCDKYGRLYTWRAANRACASLGDGWRLPTVYDWDALVNAVGGKEIAREKLRSQTGWPPDYPIGTDDVGFSALPGGERKCEDYYRRSRNYLFNAVGRYGVWWTATTNSGDGGQAYKMGIGAYEEIISDFYSGRSSPYKTEGYSVRCVRDKERRK